jgi:mannose-6-phosphate isomerase-like protein (cupin superfamily)
LLKGEEKMPTLQNIQKKNFTAPDETRSLPKTTVEVVNLGDVTVMKLTLEPGWKWSECVKSTAGTSSCQVPHLGYVLSGRLKVVMDDGTEAELGPGDVDMIAPGHDAWVIGDEPFVGLDFEGGRIYAK